MDRRRVCGSDGSVSVEEHGEESLGGQELLGDLHAVREQQREAAVEVVAEAHWQGAHQRLHGRRQLVVVVPLVADYAQQIAHGIRIVFPVVIKIVSM